MMSLFGSFVQPVVQTPQIIILISHNQVKQAIFYCSCMCLLILSCSPFSKDLRHRHQIIPWLQLPKPPNCNSYNSQLLKNVVYGSILADRAVSGEVASPVVIVFQTTGCCGASVFHPWFCLFALMSDKRTSERRWFISVDWTHEAHCCRFWFVWLFFKRSSHLVLGKGGEKMWASSVGDPIKSLSVIDWHLTRNDEACPPRPSAQAKSERSKCFLKLQFDPSIEEVHTLPSRILLHISVGIVRIQKCWALTGRPYWLEQTHNALYCCCELLTAWAGSQQWRACAEESAAGRNTWHFSVMTASLLRSFFVLYASSLCGPTSPAATPNLIWMTNTFRLRSADCFGKLHPARAQNWGPRTLFDMKSSGMRWTRTGWGIRSSFSGGGKNNKTSESKEAARNRLFHWCHGDTSLQCCHLKPL